MEPHEDPRAAGQPRQKGPTRVYERDELAVLWDATKCIHVATCIRALPQVFDPRRRPWVDVNAADADEIAAAVRLCPTGALKYESRGGVADERPEEPTTIEPRAGGPLYVRGRVQIVDENGDVIAEETRVALCRCGASANKPYCDNSHRMVRSERPLEEGE